MNYKKIQNKLVNNFKLSKSFFTQKLIKNLINKIVAEEEWDNKYIEISEKLFSGKSYEYFLRQYKSNKNFIYKNDKIYMNKELSLYTIKCYDIEKQNEQYDDEIYTLQKQEEEENKIHHINTLYQFLKNVDKEIDKDKLILNEEQQKIIAEYKKIFNRDINTQYYIVDEEVDIDNMFVLNNKENNNFKILPNPLIKTTIFNNEEEGNLYKQENNNKVIKTIIKIERKIGGSNIKGNTLISKYRYKCGRCGETFTRLPYQLSTEIKHGCKGYETESGVQKYQTIDKNKYVADSYMNLHLYECTVKTKGKKTGKKNKIHISSGSKKIKPGVYQVELLHLNISPSHGEKRQTILLLLNKKEIKPEIKNTDLFIEGSGLKISKELEIPQVKILDIIQSIRNIYTNYVGETLDNRGMWIQIANTISGMSKLIFENSKLGISVMGNKSLSKTYPATRISIMLDKDYYFSQSSTDISPAGLKGGVNNKKLINGQTTSIFEEGIVSVYGLTVFDEGSRFYTDPVMNEHLKALPQKTIQHNKIGGETVDQNYTPILLSNFTEHDVEYKKKVRENYINLKKNAMYKTGSGNTFDKKALETKLTNLNYYMPLNYYYEKYSKDMELVKALAYVRKSYDMNHIDWKNGGRIEASDRLLFDVVVSNVEKTMFDLQQGEEIDTDYSTLNPPEIEFLPAMEFIEELTLKFKTKDINLYEEYSNTNEINEQLTKLKQSISEWLRTDGIDVFYNIGKGYKKIDPKLNNLLFTTCMTVQLLEDINSTELSGNVKEWLKIFLTKCKRGMSQDEYDYVDNNTKYVKDIEFNFITVDMDIIEQHKKDEIERARIDAITKYKNKDKDVSEFVTEGETYRENTEADLKDLDELADSIQR